LSSRADDDRKPTAKRRRATSTSEEEDEDFSSSRADDDRKPTAKRCRATSTSEEEDEEFRSDKADDDRSTAKRTRTSEADDDRKPTAKRCRPTSAKATEEYKEEARISRSLLTRYSAGTKVKKFFEGHGWFLGEIASIDEDYCCYVRYEDGDEENYLLDELEDLDKIVANIARTHPRK
jgi:hypothetical protein